MKNGKKLFALLLALVMCLSIAALPAFAADDGTITINNATVGGEYKAYLMATLVSSSGSNYSYIVVEAWRPFFLAHGVPVQPDGHITYQEGITDIAAFAKDAVAYAIANSIAPTGVATAATTTVTIDKKVGSTDGLPLGYYCIDSQVGTMCSLTTTNKNAVVEDKNVPPTIDKTVEEDSNSVHGKVNDDSIGKTVNYRSIITKRAGAEKYVMTDTMSAGLTFDPASVHVYYIKDTGSGTTNVDLTAWTLVTDFSAPENAVYAGKTFVIKFSDAEIQALHDGTKIMVDYQATINENAVIGTAGNPNVATLIYGNIPTETSESKTITYVWGFDIYKYTLVGGAKTALAGAKFKVLMKDGLNESFIPVAKDDALSTAKGYPVYKVSGAPDATGTEIETDATGKFAIVGLDAGDYWLRETEAPAGYNKLTYDIECDIIAVGKYATDSTLDYAVAGGGAAKVIEVENSTGTMLPATGGLGTFLFTMIGGAVVLVTGTLLVVRKRMSRITFIR